MSEQVSGERALRDFARLLRDEMGPVWGGSAQWLTTGSKVAELVASLAESAADEYPETTEADAFSRVIALLEVDEPRPSHLDTIALRDAFGDGWSAFRDLLQAALDGTPNQPQPAGGPAGDDERGSA